MTLLRQSAPGDSWDIALPAATTNRFPELLKEGPLPDFGPIFERAYDEGGAFSYGGGLIALSIRTSAPDQVVIYDIRPVNTRRVCLPAGLLVTYGSEGGDFIEMNYNLDAARPVAHDRNADGVVTADLYFDAHTIPVAPGDDVQIEMELDAAKWAYGFDIGIDYTLDGQKFTQVVSRPGGAFHVSASLCPRRPQRESLSDADVRRLQGLRFQQVRQRGEAASGAFVVTAVDPDGYARDCQSW